MVTDEIKTQQMDVMWKYVILSYLLFWFMVMALGGSAAMVFNAPPLVQRIVEAFCAWAPTFAFFIMFKKLRPETNLKDFVKSVFSQKLRLDLMLVSGVAVVLSSIVPLLILSFSEGQSFTSFFSLKGYSLPVTLLLCLFAGPLGEELGWRGYLRVELDKKIWFYPGFNRRRSDMGILARYPVVCRCRFYGWRYGFAACNLYHCKCSCHDITGDNHECCHAAKQQSAQRHLDTLVLQRHLLSFDEYQSRVFWMAHHCVCDNRRTFFVVSLWIFFKGQNSCG